MEKQLLWKEVFCKSLFWNISQKLYKTPVPESFFKKAAGYWARIPFLWNISGRLLLVDILRKSYLESFWKIPRKTALKRSCFNNFVDSRPKTLQKHNHTEDVFLQILANFQNNFSLKIISKIHPKLCQKYVTNVVYMLKITSLTETPLNPEFLKKFWKCFSLFLSKKPYLRRIHRRWCAL